MGKNREMALERSRTYAFHLFCIEYSVFCLY
jgi:hypothetical protein